jgi:hypothetical protein
MTLRATVDHFATIPFSDLERGSRSLREEWALLEARRQEFLLSIDWDRTWREHWEARRRRDGLLPSIRCLECRDRGLSPCETRVSNYRECENCADGYETTDERALRLSTEAVR